MGRPAAFDEAEHPRRGDGRFASKPSPPRPGQPAAALRSSAQVGQRPTVDRGADLTLRRPVFVYGTLLSGFHNATLIPGSAARTPATVAGVGLWDGPGYPYCAEVPDGVVVGEMADIPEDMWERTVERLDYLEGFHAQGHPRNHYDRAVAVAVLPDGTETECYVYVASEERQATFDDADRIGGDWRAHEASRRGQRAGRDRKGSGGRGARR